MEPLGVVIKSPSIHYFIFKLFRGWEIDVGTFVAVETEEGRLLSRVTAVRYRNVASDPRLLAQFDELTTVEEIKTTLGIEDALYYTVAKAVVLGVRRDRRIYKPQKPVKPLRYVYRATESELEEFFTPPEDGMYITIGWIRGTNIPARVNADRLITQHCSILASTGAGKSWLAGVLIERLALLDVPIVVIDPHGEYSAMSVPRSREGVEVAEKVNLYVVGKVDTTPIDNAFRRRYGHARSYVRVGVNPRSVPLRTLEKILEFVYGLTDAQRRVLEEGWQRATDYGERQPLTSVEELIGEVVDSGKHAAPPAYAGEMTIRGLEGRLRALFYSSRIFITRYGEMYLGEPLRLIDPQRYLTTPQIHIFDISGLDLLDQQIFLAVLFDQMYRVATSRRDIATFIVLEEAHNFAPSVGHAVSRPYVAKFAREGRKFGLGLCLVSQRPAKLDQDVVSQTMTQVFKRMINPHDLKYVEAVAEQLEDVRQLKTLDETEALVTGVATPVPLLITVGDRWTNHGGVTPKLRKELT